MEIRVQRVRTGIDKDHARSVCLLNGKTLVDAGVSTSVAQNDLARHLSRIQYGHACVVRRREAQCDSVGIGTRQTCSGGINERRRSDWSRQR
jgi:hypothetical protein